MYFAKSKTILLFISFHAYLFALSGRCPCLDKQVTPLSKTETQTFAEKQQNWNEVIKDEQPQLIRNFHFEPEQTAYLIGLLATIAERKQHHPIITIENKIVEVSLFTHSKKAITEHDLSFINYFESLFKPVPSTQHIKKQSPEKKINFEATKTFIAKNKKWKLNNEQTKLIFTFESIDFIKLARAVAQICLLDNFISQVTFIELTYGECSLILQSQQFKEISDQTLFIADLIQKIFNQIINE